MREQQHKILKKKEKENRGTHDCKLIIFPFIFFFVLPLWYPSLRLWEIKDTVFFSVFSIASSCQQM